MRRNASILAEMVDATLDGVLGVDHQRAVVFANRAAEQLLGVAEAEALGRPLSHFLEAERGPSIDESVSAVLAGGGGARRLATHRGVRADGQLFPVEVSLSPSSSGAALACTVVIRSTDPPSLSAGAPTHLLSTAFRSSPAGMSITSLSGTLLEVNETLARSLGYTREELLGRSTLDVGIWVDPAERTKVVQDLLATGEVLGFEASLRHKNGGPVRLLCSWVLLRIGEVPHIFSVTQDLSKQLHDEARLRASERRQAFTFNASPAAMLLLRATDGALVELNDAFCRLFEVAREHALGRSMAELAISTARPRADVLELVRPTGRLIGQEVSLTTHGGRPLEVLFSGELLELEGVQHLLASVVDVTARKRAEAAAKENERRFLQIAENMREVFWLADLETAQVLYVSPAYERVTGHTREELYADTGRFLSVLHAEDRERVGEALKTRPDGRAELDFRIVRPDGTVRFMHNDAFLVPDELGKPVRIAGIAEDVTERRSLAEQVQQAQKMESIGQLAGGVAHDFNNLLTVISSSNQYLRAQLGRGDGLFNDLTAEIDSAVERATSLTRQLLAFSRQQVIAPAVLDLNDVVTETAKMLGRMLGEDVQLVTSLHPGLPEVRADQGQLSQMLLNLAVNARDAMPQGGTFTIATTEITVDERFAKTRLGLKPGKYAEVSLTDTGQGMTKEVQAHLFEPFFTTKPAGKGTGLGLAVVFGIVQQSGGHIEIDSEPGVGTTVRACFPACTQAEKLDEAASATKPVEGRETLLVVEDEDSVRWVAIRGLRARGYQVLEAASAQEAMKLLEEHQAEVALIITDVVMPDVDGRELSLMARRLCPTLPVLFTSGFTDDTVIRHGIQQDQVPFIEKPYSPNALARKVRQVLDGRAAARLEARPGGAQAKR